jgi:hypothetical protein
MNGRLVFLGFLAVIMAFYLKVQADGFGDLEGLEPVMERGSVQLYRIFSILYGLFALSLFYFGWRPPQIRQAIVNKLATAIFLAILIGFVTLRYVETLSAGGATG